MPDRQLGVTVSGDKVIIVDAEVSGSGPIGIVNDLTWDLQKGDRAKAYEVMCGRISNYARENKVAVAIVKSSAVSSGHGVGLAHLHSAELRGVVMAALASATEVRTLQKGQITKNFGKRKADEYVGDDGFWKDQTTGTLRKGSREAALQILAARK
jgi:hypothetical protein